MDVTRPRHRSGNHCANPAVIESAPSSRNTARTSTITRLIVMPTVAPRTPSKRRLSWVARRLNCEIRSLLGSAKSEGSPWSTAQAWLWSIHCSAAVNRAGEALMSWLSWSTNSGTNVRAASTRRPIVSSTTATIARGREIQRRASQRQGMSSRKAISAAVRNSPGKGANCTRRRFKTKALSARTGRTRPSRSQLGQVVMAGCSRWAQVCSRGTGLDEALT